MSLISLLLLLLLFCVCVWACRALLAAFSIGDPIATVVQIVIVLIFVFYLLRAFGFVGGGALRIT